MGQENTSIEKKQECSKQQKESTESLSITEAKEFITFCIENNVLKASFKDLEFECAYRVNEAIISSKGKELTEDELLFGSSGGFRL